MVVVAGTKTKGTCSGSFSRFKASRRIHAADRADGKWSPSLALPIPGSVTETLRWDEHSTVEPKITDGKLVREPIEAAER